MTRAEDGLKLAEHVAATAASCGVEAALIGAAALAVHGYPRGTLDIDLATDADFGTSLRRLADRLRVEGHSVAVREPDADDPLGGTLEVTRGNVAPIHVVNFFNSLRPIANPGGEAIATATPRIAGSPLRVVDLSHLIALKLYAGGPQSRADVVELLARNPAHPRDAIREVCARFSLAPEFDALT